MSWLLPINAYTALISGIFMICMGFFVFLKNPKKKLNIIYLLFTASMANWLIVSFMLYNSKTEAEAIFWDKMVYAGVVFIPAFLMHFGLIFINREKEDKIWLYFGYLFSFVFLVLSRSSEFIDGLWTYSWGVHSQAKIFHHLFLLFFSTYAIIFLWKVYKFFKNSADKDKTTVQQIKYFLISFAILLSGSYAFLAAYNINLNPLGAYILELMSIMTLAFAIMKYNLFETKIILTELLVAAMSIVLFLMPFFMPSTVLKIVVVIVFLLYCFVGYLLIKSTMKEVRAKESFEGMVKMRTKELDDRNKELEKFYQLTIGRELRMAELKDKIKEMEGKK
jgi:hypothetical protein